ncbi:MAG: glucose-6-phosphate isomerase family protein [Methanocorpusculum sp.]|nr:glucose-6-phosphate isomerase family protein [Methanocorpusculum sp.]
MKKIWPLELPEPSVRTVSDMENVFAVRPSNKNPETPLYYMYRDLYRSHGDHAWLERHHLRYDITKIPSGIINGEYTKTKGHYHPCNKNGMPFPEVYEVLSGFAYYLLQKRDHTDVILVPAHEGNVVLIPPGYGHVTINPAKEDLIMANLVSTDFASEYGEINEMHGAAYYYMKKEGWVANEHYGKAIPMHVLLPSSLPELGLIDGRSLYDMVGTTDTLDVMNRPEDFMDVIGEFCADKKRF